MLKSICLLFAIKFGYLICIKMKCFRNSDMANIMLLHIWLYLLSNLCRYTIFSVVKMLVDKHDEDDSNSDEMVGSHKRFSANEKK